MIRRSAALLSALFAAPLAVASDCAGDDLDTAVRRTLDVRAYTLQPLTIPAGEAVSIRLILGGHEYAADLTLDPADAPGCTMVLDDGSGTLKELPPPPPVTYRGTLRDEPGSMISGSIIDGQFTGIVYLQDGPSAWNVVPLTEAVPGAPKAMHIVSRFEDSEPGNWTCGVTGTVPIQPHAAAIGAVGGQAAPPGGSPQDAVLYCELAIEADYPFFLAVGGTASTVAHDISAVVNNVSSYSILSGTNVRYRIVRYLIRVTAQGNPPQYSVTNPSTLLSNFRMVWNNLAGNVTRDTAHMFTGQDLSGTTIGIAYLGAICNTTFAYGLSESRFSLQPGRRAALTAHELGHNFSANHCDVSPNVCTPCWLMLAAQGSTTDQLTRYGCSTTLIANYASARPCLGPNLRAASCPADFDGSGTLTAADLAAFHAALCAGDPRADADADGRLTVADFTAFLNQFALGCP